MVRRLATYYRNIGAIASGINAATAKVKRHLDDTELFSSATAGVGTDAGFATATRPNLGYPGPVYTEIEGGGFMKRDSGKVTGQIGPIWADDIPDMFANFGIGAVSGLNVTASGTNRDLTVVAGKGVFKDGLPFLLEANTVAATLAVGDGTNPRIDRLVLRVWRRGNAEEGKFAWVVIQGTPAATPAAPALVQDANTWDYCLGQIAVAAGATSISQGNVTDMRYNTTLGQAYAFSWPTGLTHGDMFYINNGVYTRRPVGTTGQVLQVVGGVPAWSSTINASTIIGTVYRGGGTATSLAYAPVGTYPGAGSGATGGIAGYDSAGELTLTTGTGTVTGDVCKISFGTTKANTNYAVALTARSNNAASDTIKTKVGKAADGFLIQANGALNASSTYIWSYIVMEWT